MISGQPTVYAILGEVCRRLEPDDPNERRVLKRRVKRLKTVLLSLQLYQACALGDMLFPIVSVGHVLDESDSLISIADKV